MDLREIGWEDVNLVHLVWDWDQRWALVTALHRSACFLPGFSSTSILEEISSSKMLVDFH